MKVLVIGATGGTGRALLERLVADGDEVRAMTRDPARSEELADAGAEPVVADLVASDPDPDEPMAPRARGDGGGSEPTDGGGQDALRSAIDGVDAVAFCAGSGSSTGADATLRVDLHGAVRTIDACVDLGVRRYVMLSSIAAGDPDRGAAKIRHYLAAKHAADRILLASGLQATVVRPGGLTHDAATGHVELGVPRLAERGQIPRADVAQIMASCLRTPATAGAVFEVVSGSTPIDDAVASLSDRTRAGA